MALAPPAFTDEQVAQGFGAYDEIEFLGSGSFGDTYRILRGDDEFVLKILRTPGRPDYLWERELESLRRVDHPNVVGFLDSGVLSIDGNDHAYLTCEHVSGGDVGARIGAHDLPSEVELRELLTGLLAGVSEIHDLGILHRDIKPANVALDEGDWGRPVLLDFGLARVLDMSTHTAYPAMMGTPAYMAPEQLRGQPARRRSDLFSLAAVVYEAGTGRHPYRSPTVTTVQGLHDRIKAGPPDSPSSIRSEFPDDVEHVVTRLLSYWGHERLGISEALQDLESS